MVSTGYLQSTAQATSNQQPQQQIIVPYIPAKAVNWMKNVSNVKFSRFQEPEQLCFVSDQLHCQE